MNREHVKRWGLIGLLLLALASVVYFFTRSQRSQRAREIPPDDLT